MGNKVVLCNFIFITGRVIANIRERFIGVA